MMKDWIKKNIDPPGIEKKNRGSIFSAIGKVFETVRRDAEKAFKAHFPYLADLQTLRKHGKSLGIPEFPYDSEDEFRERVSAASFFLARAGERAYILDQMRGHFGDEFVLQEDFLKVYMNIAEMSEEDRIWVHSLLDELLDPNISMLISEWFHFIDEMPMSEVLTMRARRRDIDSFAGIFLCNGRFYCNQGKEIICDGTWVCDGSVKCVRFAQAIGTILDFYLEGIFANGQRICDGSFNCSGYEEVFAPVTITHPVLLSSEFGENFAATLFMEPMQDQMLIADGPMKLRIIKELHCNGVKSPSCSKCDGSIICDGSYTGYDGLFYSGDLIQEEVLV
jgi:hypothetical protein